MPSSRRHIRRRGPIPLGSSAAEAMERALAEHIAAHPEDAGRTVADFKWIVHEIVSPLLGPRHLAVGPKSSLN